MLVAGEQTSAVFSESGEAIVLGCCMMDDGLVDESATSLTPADFYDLRHANIFDLMMRLRDKRIPVTPLTIRDEATASLDAGVNGLGGLSYLASLSSQTPSTKMLPHYVGVVSRKARLRRYINGANEIISQAKALEGDDDAKLDEVEKTLATLMQSTAGGGEVRLTDVVKQAIDEIEQAHAHEGSCTGIASGFPALDRLLTGFHDGDMAIVAARPSMGKTSLAMSIAENMALDQKIPVGIFSMEMTATSLIKRTISARSEIDGHDLLTGNLTNGSIKRITTVAARINGSPIFIDERPSMTLPSLSSRARRMVARDGVKAIFVDYLQLMRAKADSRVREVSIISSGLKAVAKELGIPVIVLSQLSRSVESQERPPRLSDLRDSGSIEQDADVVVMLHRPKNDSNLMDLMVQKHRNGPTGIVELEFDKAHTKFRNPTYFKPESDV